jgi:hypothetical protein
MQPRRCRRDKSHTSRNASKAAHARPIVHGGWNDAAVTAPTPRHLIARPSVASLLLVGRVNQQPLSSPTGFLVEREASRYLVTNWHVASGRRPDDGQPLSQTGAVPDELSVTHNVAGQLGTWMQVDEPLYTRPCSGLSWPRSYTAMRSRR